MKATNTRRVDRRTSCVCGFHSIAAGQLRWPALRRTETSLHALRLPSWQELREPPCLRAEQASEKQKGRPPTEPSLQTGATKSNAYCCAPVAGCCCGASVNVNAVNCISSHVCSPQCTSTLASGFDLFAAELSYHAEECSTVPFGSFNGCLKM